MYRDLTKGNITRGLVLFALPMIAGNLLQQLYNIADTLIVGRALRAQCAGRRRVGVHAHDVFDVGFPRPVHGRGRAVFHLSREAGQAVAPQRRCARAGLILGVTLLLNAAVYLFLDEILLFLQIPAELAADMRTYLLIIFAGLLATLRL